MWMMDHGRLHAYTIAYAHLPIMGHARHGMGSYSYGNGQANQWIESGHGKAVG
jgi:hypothetical protein